MKFLPIYCNLEDFQDKYLIHFQEFKDDEDYTNEGFQDYLEYYLDLIIDTYHDITQEVSNNNLNRLQEIVKTLNLSDRILKKYIHETYSKIPDDIDYLTQPNNFAKFKTTVIDELHGFSENKDMNSGLALTLYGWATNDILSFIHAEILKLSIYNDISNLRTGTNILPTVEHSNLPGSVEVNNKRHSAPVIIAMLKELKVFGEMNKRGFSKSAIIDSLYQIIGSNKKNLEKYYDSMIKDDEGFFTENHSNTAKNFLNSKGF